MSEKLSNQNPETPNNGTNPWDTLSKMPPFEPPILGTAWDDFPSESEGIDERPDIDGVPQTVWRGERLYLDNIDEIGSRVITTKGHEAIHNANGKIYMARNKLHASFYAVGTDGVTFYEGPLPKEQIPIGVVYRIDNTDNHIQATPTEDKPFPYGPFAGKFCEFTTDADIPPEDYSVTELYIMDDFVQPNGHTRSDVRRPLEVYKVADQKDLPKIIKRIKERIDELDQARKAQ